MSELRWLGSRWKAARFAMVSFLARRGLPGLSFWVRFQNYKKYSGQEILQIGSLSEGMTRGTALDIGAADGLYAYQFRKLGFRVVAFEANPNVAARLRAAMPWLRLEETALSNTAGEARLSVPFNGGREVYGLGSIEAGVRNFDPDAAESMASYSVKTSPLDDFDLDNLSWIKIDVEGHEKAVVEGAMGLIRKWRPKMLIEMGGLDRQVDNGAILEQLRRLGYSFFYVDGRNLVEFRDDRLTITRDLFCIPSVGV